MQSGSFALRASVFYPHLDEAPFATQSPFPFTVFKYSCCCCLRTKFLSAASSAEGGFSLSRRRLYLVLHFRSSIIIIGGVRHVISQPRAPRSAKKAAHRGEPTDFSPHGKARSAYLEFPSERQKFSFGTNFLLQPTMRNNFSFPPNNSAQISKETCPTRLSFNLLF